MHNLDVKRARRILITQALCTVLVAGVALALSLTAGISALIGGATATLANALFAVGVFARYRAQNPGKLMFRFYGAELLKLLFVALAFGVVFSWVRPLHAVALLGAFLVVQIVPPMLVNRVAS